MDYAYFQSLATKDAESYLDAFLVQERAAVKATEARAREQCIPYDFTLSSIVPVLGWLMTGVHGYFVPMPSTEPWWIQEAHPNGMLEFHDDAKTAILRSAYYLGESFVRASTKLKWGIGDKEFMQMNMPVVTRFRHKKELPPILVCENICSRILQEGESKAGLQVMVESWIRFMP
jgi:hypothetical protein